MKIRLFGKELFEFHGKGGDAYAVPSMGNVAKLTHLPDFKDMGHGGAWSGSDNSLQTWTQSTGIITISDVASNTVNGASGTGVVSMPATKTAKQKEKDKLSPKRVYDMRMLHDKGFKLNMNPAYVDKQIADFKAKLAMMKDPQYDYRGSNEIGSILLRMENRKKYPKVKATFEKYPYTTNKRIESVLKNHDYLQIGEVSQFLADMPAEATEAMKDYNLATTELCGKKAVFYIIADKKDFKKTNSRRDPILLAQSPFGHFWQIIGAWDEEMLFLEEL